MSVNKRLLKKIFIVIGVFSAFFVASFFALIVSVYGLYKERAITEEMALNISFIGSVFVGIIGICIYFIWKKNNKYKLFSSVGAKIIFAIFLFQGFLSALNYETILSIETAQKLLEIEWMIFSIAIALFLVWHAIISKILMEKSEKNKFGYYRINEIVKRRQKYKDLANFSYNLVLLTISLFCLVVITPIIYVDDNINSLTQFILIFNITIVINAMMVIFYDIAMPLLVELVFEKKDKMTDEQIVKEIILAIVEERLYNELDREEQKPTKEEITSLAMEVLDKISKDDIKIIKDQIMNK